MRNKVIALFAALGILAATAAPANAWYGGWGYGGWGYGGYGAALGIGAGAALLGGIIGGAIAGGGGYGGYGYAPAYNPWGVSYGWGYQPGYTVYQPAPGYYEGW